MTYQIKLTYILNIFTDDTKMTRSVQSLDDKKLIEDDLSKLEA